MGHAGEFEMLLMLAVLRLGDDAYGMTIRSRGSHERDSPTVFGGARRCADSRAQV